MLIVPYGYGDDYMNLALADRLGLSSPPFGTRVIVQATAEGRPFWGVLMTPVLALADTVDNLRFVRILTVAGIVALALLLYRALAHARLGRLPAVLIALLISTLPAFQLHAAFTINFPIPWAALLAGCASLLTAAAVDGPKRLKLDRLVGATAALIAAILIYQPTGMYFWVFLAIALVGSLDDPPRAVRLARAHFALGAAALALSYLGYKLCLLLVGDDAPRAFRGALLTEGFVDKARWFGRWALYLSLNLYDLTPSVWLATLVALVAAGGIGLWLIRRTTRPYLFAALALVLVPLSYLPNLVVEESIPWPTYRTYASLSSLIALYFCLGALAMWVTFREWLGQRVSRRALIGSERAAAALAVAFVAMGVVSAARNVNGLIVQPQWRELKLLRSEVAALPHRVRHVAFVLSGPAEREPGTHFGSEFGAPSTTDWPTPEALTLLLLREQGRLVRPHPIVEVLPWYTASIPEGASVVNLNGRLQSP